MTQLCNSVIQLVQVFELSVYNIVSSQDENNILTHIGICKIIYVVYNVDFRMA